MNILAVCGIDTGVGKSVVTGLLARWLLEQGQRVTTMKLVETGGGNRSGDVLLHRRLMGQPWSEDDEVGHTCPFLFPFPASPHLAARLAGARVDPARLDRAMASLAARHDHVLVEGAGGLLSPLHDELPLADFLAERGIPLLLVTCARLGSINHTLLCLEAIRHRGLTLAGMVYNTHPPVPVEIESDSRRLFRRWLDRLGFACPLLELRHDGPVAPCDFSPPGAPQQELAIFSPVSMIKKFPQIPKKRT